MTTWLEYVNITVSAVTDEDVASVAPKGRGCKHEHVVGVATPELKKLYFLYVNCSKRAQETKRELAREEDPTSASVSELRKEAISYDVHAEAYAQIFWASLRHTYPELSDKTFIGVREGWKVIWSEHSSEEESLGDILDVLVTGDALALALAATAGRARRQ